MTSSAEKLEKSALDLVELALGLEEEKREDFVRESAGGDAALHERALAILSRSSRAPQFLRTGGAIAQVIDEATPEEIAGFKIERSIGRGGMGAVYLGRRPDADFDHVVAIKLVRSAASPRLLERLRYERRMLARLKHPHIAQMYDGGETPDGQPYFIMEYAGGAPLSKYLQDKAPSVDERLNIFCDVCSAVAYAHKNLVIHRDLSPSNILVTDEGRAKLIDFGIAQSMEGPEDDAFSSKLTMTKGYAAPERVKGESASTITDVYSLGVILKEMMEGLAPPRRGDLRAIADMAAAQAPEDRYSTVDALLADIAAYREARAVNAVKQGWRYKTARFVGRRKLAVGAGAFAAIAMIASSLAFSFLYVRADAAEQRAQQRFDEVRELAGFILFDLHDGVARLEGSTPVREMLAETALDYLDTLRNAPDVSKELRLEVAQGYKRLSDVTGHPQMSNLGRLDEAIRLVEIAVEEIRALRTEYPDDERVARAFAEILGDHAYLSGAAAVDFERALSLNREALEAIASLGAGADINDRLLDARLHARHGDYLYRSEDYDEAVAQLQESVSLYEGITAAHPENTEARLGLASASAALGVVIRWRAVVNETALDAAVPALDRAVLESRRLANAEQATPRMKTQYIASLLKRANTLCYVAGREDQGLADLDELASLSTELLQADPQNNFLQDNLSYATLQKIDCLSNAGRLAEAIEIAEEAVAGREASQQRAPENPALLRDLANAYSVVSALYVKAEEWPKACEMARRIDATWKRFQAADKERSAFSASEDERNRQLLEDCMERGVLVR